MSAPISNTTPGRQPGQAPDRAQGFIQSHISPRDHEISPSLSIFADLVKVHVPAQSKIGGGLRGQVRGFTPQSRKRFMEAFARARNVTGGSFVTLTYPNEFPTDPEIYHAHLDTLLKRLARWEPNARGFWRLEFQQRGAPHFHLLIFGARRNTRQLRRWFKVAWYQVVGSGNLYHFQAGTQCDTIANRKHAMRYIAKYAAKTSQDRPASVSDDMDARTGRLWGTFGHLESAPALVVPLTLWQVIEVRRALVRWLHSRQAKFEKRLARSSAWQGFAVFGAGDLSNEVWTNVRQSMIFRMIEPFLDG